MKNSGFKLIAVLLMLAFISAGFSAVTFADNQHVSGVDTGINIKFDDSFAYSPFTESEAEIYLITIEGKTAYCLEYGASLSFSDGFTERQSQADYEGFNATTKELIQMAMHYGYPNGSFGGLDANESYFVTQVLVWLIATGYFNTAAEEAIIDVFFENMDNCKAQYLDIKAKIINAKLYPSFNGKTIDLLYVSGTYSATVTDTNGVLNEYEVVEKPGITATINKNDNTLTLNTSNPGEIEITMTREFKPGAVVYWVDTINSMQALVTADANSDNLLQASVKVRATPVKPIEILKTGELLSRAEITDTEFGQMYNTVFEKKPLAGVVFQIIVQQEVTYTENGVLVTKFAGTVMCEMTTDAYGKATSAPIPVYASYILREISTVNGFILKADYPFDHTYIKVENLKLEIDNTRQKLNIAFQKNMELGIGKTIKPYDEVVFGIFTAQEISAGADKIPIDSLVALITPDSAGNAQCKDLPAGKYYLKELKTAVGYILKGTEYQFTLSYDGSGDLEIELSINDGNPIYNDIIKGKGKVKKIDRSGKGLAGAVFHVYTADGYFVAELVSDKNGNTAEVELSYGRYYWVEIKAPEGCRLDKTKYYFEIIENGFIYETTIKNYYSSVKTGDESVLLLWVTLAFCSAFVIWGANRRRKIMIRK